MERQLLNVQNAASIAAVNAAAVSSDVIGDAITQALALVFDVTSLTGTATPSLQLIIELKDSVSGKYISFGTFTAVTAAGTYTYLMGLGIGAASDGITAIKNFPPPDSFRVRVVGGGGTITDADFTVTAHRL